LHQAIRHETVSVAARADDHVKIGRLLQRAQQHSDALQEYEAALQEQPNHPGALHGRGETLLELKRYQEAIEALGHCLEVGPASAEVHQLRALARTNTGDYRGALDDYSWALQSEATAARYARRGWIYIKTDVFKLAQEDFDQAIRLGPATGDMYAGRGFALVQLGDTKQAIDDAQKASQLGPETPLHLSLHLWKVARIYSQALGRLDSTPKARNAALRLDYLKKSVQLITRAVDGLSPGQQPLFWKNTIHPDKALDPLRRYKEFSNLEQAQADKLPR
jgi:tetratricopeptide (TPR) repeat protein